MTSEGPGWPEEAFAAFVENQKRQDALRRQRLAERGEVLVELVPAGEEDSPRDEAFQAGLSNVSSALRANSVEFSQRTMTFDSAEAVGYPLPEFTVLLKTLGPVAIGALGAVAGAWVQGKHGRKVRIKIGDLEAEGRSPSEVESLLQMAKEYRAGEQEGSSDDPHINKSS